MGVLLGLVPSSSAPAPPPPSALSSSSSSAAPTLGIVWTPPSPPDSALSALDRIAATGATAVRLTRLPPDTIAGRADSLGLRLYVDLPIRHASAASLADTLSRVGPTLTRLLALADRHPSITHVGLAQGVDTTVPQTCEHLRRWASRVHGRSPSLQTYYVTPFASTADRCRDAVDRPLLDLRGRPRPAEQWQAWPAHTNGVGIGALGTWTRPSASSGLQVPHSAERQARYLETSLSRLLNSSRTTPPVVFVARWQDAATPPLPARHYGLHDAAGIPRPAARVVQGIYADAQRTFAFPDGSPPASSYGLVLVGWGLVAALGLLYARSLFVRETVVRYFAAPGFYRDALRNGRDASFGANGLLLGLVGGSLGLTATRMAQLAAAAPVTEHVLAALPLVVRTALGPGIRYPVLAGLIVGGGAIVGLLLWMGVLVATARLGMRFSGAQGLMLIAWPCWPVLLVPPIALAAGPGAPLSPSLFSLMLLGGSALALLSVSFRVLFDHWRVCDPPAWTLLPLVALSPLVLVGTSLLGAAQYGVPFLFLWRLAVYA
ncbi:hypothetical protein [Salinibacter altiplanensis]|uniref:hypothetical protein n=1 Tax=Salinibacter altiplanensis TaxID=1803181 RepID=UPI001F203E88|nr:hypothetical protein [Salinibacter altiplanensis]